MDLQPNPDLDLSLRLGPPGVEGRGHPEMDWNALQQYLSPNFELHERIINPIQEIKIDRKSVV